MIGILLGMFTQRVESSKVEYQDTETKTIVFEDVARMGPRLKNCHLRLKECSNLTVSGSVKSSQC